MDATAATLEPTERQYPNGSREAGTVLTSTGETPREAVCSDALRSDVGGRDMQGPLTTSLATVHRGRGLQSLGTFSALLQSA